MIPWSFGAVFAKTGEQDNISVKLWIKKLPVAL
jgi:hypothetical protein